MAESLCSMMEVTLFFKTLSCIIAIAFNLYVLEVSGTVNMEAVVAIVDMLLSIAVTFVCFYIAEWISIYMLDIADIFYDSPWYRLPVEQQKLLVLPIQRAQRQFRLKGLGMFDCSLAVFSSVISALELTNSTGVF